MALTTALFWGLLPIALSVVLTAVDPYTVTWLRFLTAALALGAILAGTGQLPELGALRRRAWLVLAIALAGLAGNFVLYVVALRHASPTINQVVSQLSPMLLLLGGVIAFGERLSRHQWAGFSLLLCGLPLFFNRRLPELVHLHSGLGLGVGLLVLASLVWVFYGLSQKLLLKCLQPQQVLVLLYTGAALVLWPASTPQRLVHLSGLQLAMLAFCCLNTVVAYGAFAEALRHWDVSRVGATLAMTPLFTMSSMWLVSHLVPRLLRPERLNGLSVCGALLVILGSALCALSPRATSPC